MATRSAASLSRTPHPLKMLASLPEGVAHVDPVESAAEAGLVYTTDERPGFTRKRHGKKFRYFDTSGRTIVDPREIARIDGLGIPPAHTGVWISPNPLAHLQATGKDVRGRKQYIYHSKWRVAREETKYQRMMVFGQALPKLRKAVESDMASPGLGRRKVLAAVVRLLETTLIRVGNEQYARTNESFGLTTLRDEHVDFKGDTLRFHFRGKSGKEHEIDLRDKRLARIVHSCQDIPGQDLFQYREADGTYATIGSSDVNEYIREVAGEDFTAKDFRTWAGTVLTALALQSLEKFENPTQAKKNLIAAVKSVAKKLGNTPAVCRKSYIHPAVMDAYLEGTMVDSLKTMAEGMLEDEGNGLTRDEVCVLAFLAARLQQEKENDAAKAKVTKSRRGPNTLARSAPTRAASRKDPAPPAARRRALPGHAASAP